MTRTFQNGSLLSSLLPGIGAYERRGEGDPLVSEVAYDSSQATRGSLFFCVPGLSTDGHDFAPAAVAAGAVALVTERALDLDAPQIIVSSVRAVMGEIAAAFYGRPADRLTIVGITGTNGKTTTTYLLESVFRAAGMTPGVIGTVGVRVDGRSLAAEHTTPEAPDLQRLLVEMLEAGVDAVAMEVSSHGLDQHRVGGVRFSCAVFTNLSQDHLDYHETLEDYFLAKARLFSPEMADRAAINVDNEAGRRLLGDGVDTVTYGVAEDADVRATGVQLSSDGIAFDVGEVHVASKLRGFYNVENCLAAFAAGRAIGIDDDRIVAGLEAVAGVPGRLEPVDGGQPFAVLVDYAHTPDSVENVLRAARPLTDGRLIVVLGCGGDRDRTKRPKMGSAATGLADLTLITSDNPRSEDPLAIIAEIEPGAADGGGDYMIEPDRRLAIRKALREAGPGDVVVIAGKGHETGQQFADRTIPFDDRIVAAEELQSMKEDA